MSVDPFAGIRELSRALDRKQVSAVELASMYLERLDGVGREHRAVAELTREHALEQAKTSDERRAKGRKIGALDGIPFGAKDLLATSGIPTRWGSPGHADQVFDFDATAIARLYAQGAVLVAKLAMIELAGGGNYNMPGASATGACLSAFDKKRWAGGSSSGSGAATMLGAVGFSLGSETSGSITCPCAFNGASGIRPTYGRVSRHGAMPLCWTLDKIGPIARSIEDCGIVLQAIAGHDPQDPSTLREPLRLRSSGPKPVIGLLQHDFKANAAQACQEAYESAIRVFEKLGYQTVEVAYPVLPYGLAVEIIVNAEGASAHEHFIRSERLHSWPDKDQMAGMAAALETPAVDYLWALRFRTEALKANSVWDRCGCIFTPVFYHAAVPAEGTFDKTWRNMGGDGGPANLLGWPSAAFPIGMEDGAPLGGQVIAPAMREDVSYRVAMDFQRATEFHRARPAGV